MVLTSHSSSHFPFPFNRCPTGTSSRSNISLLWTKLTHSSASKCVPDTIHCGCHRPVIPTLNETKRSPVSDCSLTFDSHVITAPTSVNNLRALSDSEHPSEVHNKHIAKIFLTSETFLVFNPSPANGRRKKKKAIPTSIDSLLAYLNTLLMGRTEVVHKL